MTEETFKQGMKRFLLVFRDNIDVNDDMQEEWFRVLRDLEDERFLFAVDQINTYRTYFGKVDNYPALIREYSKHYVVPDKRQSYVVNDELWRIKVAEFKKDLKKEKGIDYDSLGKTERDKCIAYVRMIMKDKESIFDIIDKMG